MNADFLKGYVCGFLTVPMAFLFLYAVWVLTWGNMFRKRPK